MAYAAMAARFLVASVFLFGALAKAGQMADFRRAVENYRLLPSWAIRPVAIAVLIAEFAAGSGLFLGVGSRFIALGIILLLLVFTVAIIINLVRGRNMDCGCLGTVAPQRLTWMSVARNVVIACLAGTVVVWVTGDYSILPLWVARGPADGVGDPTATLIASTALAMAARVAVEARAMVLLARRQQIGFGEPQ